jgi:hypothetical protein
MSNAADGMGAGRRASDSSVDSATENEYTDDAMAMLTFMFQLFNLGVKVLLICWATCGSVIG